MANIMLTAEKIRMSLAQPHSLKIQDDPNNIFEVEYSCTASIGATLFKAEIGSEDKMLERADQAMYKAKESGRNRVEFADS